MASTFDATTADGTKLTFELRLNVELSERIHKALGINLDDILDDPEAFTRLLFAKPGKLVQLVWMFCEDQAAKKGVAEENFGRLFDGDTLEAAVSAVVDAVIGFFPKARGREEIRKGLPRALQKMERVANRAVVRGLDKMLAMDEDELLNSAGRSPASSALTPDR